MIQYANSEPGIFKTTSCSAKIMHVFQSSRCEIVTKRSNESTHARQEFKLQIDMEIKDFRSGDRVCVSCPTPTAEFLIGMSAREFARLDDRRVAETFNSVLFKCFDFVLCAEPRLHADHTYRVRLVVKALKPIPKYNE